VIVEDKSADCLSGLSAGLLWPEGLLENNSRSDGKLRLL